MKDYKEIAQDVLRRGAEEIERNQRRRRMFLCGGCTVAVAGFVVAAGVGVWRGRTPRQEAAAGQFASLELLEKMEEMEKNGAYDVDGKDAGDLGMGDGSRPGSMGVDGDPGGYGLGLDGDPSGYDPVPGGDPSGYDPVPGGDPSGYDGTGKEELDPAGVEEHPDENAQLAQDAGMDVAGKFLGSVPDGGIDTAQPMEMISSYPEDAIYCYAAPKNGEVFCSAPLTHAMEQYGDTVLYRVMVELFHDGEMLDAADGEAKLAMERVVELGYTVAWEKYDDGEKVKHYYMIHATKEQLTAFDAGEEYGYMLRFLDEE